MKFSLSGFRTLPSSALSAVSLCGLAALLSACGQNPGETGLDYLEQQGIRVSTPLYHLTFDDLPVDSVFSSEVPLNHFGETLLVVGRESDYTAKARLGFQISTNAERDTLAQGLRLRLVARPLSVEFAGRAYLRASVKGRDSLRLLVESFSVPDSTAGFADSFAMFRRQILTSSVSFSTLDTRYKKLDTITVYPAKAYPDSGIVQDSLQTGLLPNLFNRLRNGGGSDTARRWAIFIELSPLTTADSGMFQFIGQVASSNASITRRYNSGLWLGRHNEDSLLTVGTVLKPYLMSSGFGYAPATNYEVRYSGPASRSLLHGVARGMHLRINRDTLISRIRLKLNALVPSDPTLGDRLLGANPTGTFDRRFFVPYAAMRLPLDSARTRVQGPFALDMGVSTDVDSLADAHEAFPDNIAIATADSMRLVVRGGSGASPADTLVVAYRVHPLDPALRQALLRWTRNGALADTFNLEPNGLNRELALRRPSGWARSPTLNIQPGSTQLGVQVYFNVAGVGEPSFLLDSNGRNITRTSELSRRFWRPGADSLNLRVTRGLRNILNRVHTPGVGVAPDMFLRSIDRAAFDTSTISGLTYRRIDYPVFGEIEFKRAGNGRLEVGLDLYLYPLEAGQ
jgi:hypothetical protein